MKKESTRIEVVEPTANLRFLLTEHGATLQQEVVVRISYVWGETISSRREWRDVPYIVDEEAYDA